MFSLKFTVLRSLEKISSNFEALVLEKEKSLDAPRFFLCMDLFNFLQASFVSLKYKTKVVITNDSEVLDLYLKGDRINGLVLTGKLVYGCTFANLGKPDEYVADRIDLLRTEHNHEVGISEHANLYPLFREVMIEELKKQTEVTCEDFKRIARKDEVYEHICENIVFTRFELDIPVYCFFVKELDD